MKSQTDKGHTLEYKIKATYLLEFDGVIPAKKNNVRYGINSKGRKSFVQIYYTKEYDDWEKWLPLWALANFRKKYGTKIIPPFEEKIVMVLRIWPKDNRRDTVNAMAGIADALEWHKNKKLNGFYKNDRQIIDARTINMGVDKDRPRFTVEVNLIDDGQKQLF